LAIGAPVVAVVVAVLMAPRAGGPQLCCPRTASHFVAVNGSFVRELSMLDIGHASWPSLNIFSKMKVFRWSLRNICIQIKRIVKCVEHETGAKK
jgi:hypothetical protein